MMDIIAIIVHYIIINSVILQQTIIIIAIHKMDILVIYYLQGIISLTMV